MPSCSTVLSISRQSLIDNSYKFSRPCNISTEKNFFILEHFHGITSLRQEKTSGQGNFTVGPTLTSSSKLHSSPRTSFSMFLNGLQGDDDKSVTHSIP
ncbi:hypothetical protein V6N13_087973 [Hibiscus sabdariffa]|uniref:Uncharacterized protein n=1 Tax=Hibiscus sabdariffa TaxID=183260 RepID=A0ABR2FXW6_9ROSI